MTGEADTQDQGLSAATEAKDPPACVIPPEILNTLPPEARQKVAELSVMMSQSMPLPHPLTQKITPQHIDKALDIASQQENNALANQLSARRYLAFYSLLGVGAFLFLTWFLVGSDKEVYLEVLKLLVVFVGGLGSGYGIKSRAGKDE